MLRIHRLNHRSQPLHAAEREGRWRLVDGDIFGSLVEGAEISGDGASWLAPVVPVNVVCVDGNYKPLLASDEAAWPAEPSFFLKPAAGVIGPGMSIDIPRGIGRVDHQASVGVVIRKTTRRVAASRAAEHILGLVAVNDVVARDVAAVAGQAARARVFDTFTAIGPAVAVGLDGRDLHLRTYVNGHLRQDARTRDMIFTIPEIVEFVSASMTLLPGDIIATGTPAGSGPIEPGDQVTIHVEGVGALTNPVVWRGE